MPCFIFYFIGGRGGGENLQFHTVLTFYFFFLAFLGIVCWDPLARDLGWLVVIFCFFKTLLQFGFVSFLFFYYFFSLFLFLFEILGSILLLLFETMSSKENQHTLDFIV